jgi:hypothetical protein
MSSSLQLIFSVSIQRTEDNFVYVSQNLYE